MAIEATVVIGVIGVTAAAAEIVTGVERSRRFHRSKASPMNPVRMTVAMLRGRSKYCRESHWPKFPGTLSLLSPRKFREKRKMLLWALWQRSLR